MWQLDNHTPFAAERSWVRDRDGAEVWLVVVKASFDILADGSLRASVLQPPVLRIPEHHGEPGHSSIKYDHDFVLRKRNTDILVIGHAQTPDGSAVTQLDCGLRVGPVTKLLRVFGDRHWLDAGRSFSAPAPFVKMPLRWERAYGGSDPRCGAGEAAWDERNPIGAGFIVKEEHAWQRALPNFEHPADPITHWNDRPAPVGLGALAGHWQSRAARAGTYDAQWQRTRAPLLPADFDELWYQSAPIDQQTRGHLVGGESVVLINLGMHEHQGRLQFDLPRLALDFETLFHDGTHLRHNPPALHTVILEPDLPRVSLVWHSALACHARVHKLDRTLVTLGKPGLPGMHQPGQVAAADSAGAPTQDKPRDG